MKNRDIIMKQKNIESLLNPFRSYLVWKNMSSRTVKEYEYELLLFNRFLKEKEILFVDNITADSIQEFFFSLKNKNGSELAPSTINRKLYAIRSFFNFLIKKMNYPAPNPALNVDTVFTTTLGIHTYLSLDQAKTLLENIKRDVYFPRNLLFIKFMLLLGLRVSEVANINLADIDKNNKTLTVIGKRNKERTLPLSKELLEDIEYYLAYRAKIFLRADQSKALFLSRAGNRLCVRRMQYIVCQNIDILGFNNDKDLPSRKKITCHKLRHTFGTLLAQNGVDLLTLKELLGHASVNTALIYTKASDTRMRNAIENNPLNK